MIINRFIYILFVFFFVASCRQEKEKYVVSESKPVLADVLSMNPLLPTDRRDQPPTFAFETKEFHFLKNLEELDGPYFKMYRGGEISLSEENDALEFHGEQNAKLNYKIVKQVVVPNDYSTLAMLSAYYQFDTIAYHLPDIIGVKMDDISEILGKIEIFFEPTWSERSNSIIVSKTPKANAAYIASLHKFVLFSRSRFEQVPLAINLQVISHEFGHSMWEVFFDHGRTKNCDRLSSEYVIAGLNEGFADFFSYTFTGSTNILQTSTNSTALARMRNFGQLNFTYADVADIANEKNSICDQSFYCIGTLFASALFKTQKKLNFYNQNVLEGPNGRGAFLTEMATALLMTRANISSLPSLPFDFNSCGGNLSARPIYDGFVLGGIFDSFLRQISNNSLKQELCRSFIENFGSTGFPVSSRTQCFL